MKKQVVAIHGGSTYNTYEEYFEHLKAKILKNLDDMLTRGWRDSLRDSLGDDYEVVLTRMPNSKNSKYAEWKIWFDKIVPFLNDGVILVGHSLGGIFLAKYLAENKFPAQIKATILVAAPYGADDVEESLGDFTLPNSLEKFSEQGGKIYLYQSKDDHTVPYSNVEKYAKQLPKSEVFTFVNRGHFLQETFPELVAQIKSL
jgi:predicted alpha/beta hydrolase family esterase